MEARPGHDVGEALGRPTNSPALGAPYIAPPKGTLPAPAFTLLQPGQPDRMKTEVTRSIGPRR